MLGLSDESVLLSEFLLVVCFGYLCCYVELTLFLNYFDLVKGRYGSKL